MEVCDAVFMGFIAIYGVLIFYVLLLKRLQVTQQTISRQRGRLKVSRDAYTARTYKRAAVFTQLYFTTKCDSTKEFLKNRS